MNYNFSVISQKKIRVDIYLSALFPDFSRSYIQKIIDKGQVFINSKKISKNIKINPRDEIKIIIKTEKLDLKPQKMDLDIIFEDENLLIINKNAGINVHPVPGEGGKENTLVNGILYHYMEEVEEWKSKRVEEYNSIMVGERERGREEEKKSENGDIISNKKIIAKLPSINGVERPGIVHRLDKDTSGIILTAKTDAMMNYLSNIIKERKIKKHYLAIVSGVLKTKKFKIESYIGRDKNDRKKMSVKNPINPKIALTQCEVLDYIDEKYTLLDVEIFTGRTHQIRVHLASIGFPIIGDKVYGNEKVNREVLKKFGLERQALHAKNLEFELYGENIFFEAKLKNDMKKIIEKI